MCGIVGFTGVQQAAPILLDGLSKLEYRGYDSAGIAVCNDKGETVIVRAKGKLKELVKKTDEGRAVPGVCGIGHTRWATHGEPSENNAHPHTSDDGAVTGVHNGIIENYKDLKDKLLFFQDTDRYGSCHKACGLLLQEDGRRSCGFHPQGYAPYKGLLCPVHYVQGQTR